MFKMERLIRNSSIVSFFAIALALVAILLNYNDDKKPRNTFVCAVNCMDGRVQDSVKNYMKLNFSAQYVDMVNEAGPDKILAENNDIGTIENIRKRVEISVRHHGVKFVAIVGHFGCAGNPSAKAKHIVHLKKAKKTVENFGFKVKVILLWVEEGWNKVERVQ